MENINHKSFLDLLGFRLKNGTKNSYHKFYGTYEIVINFYEKEPKRSEINYGESIEYGRQTTCNFSQPESLVVLECINRLLDKGYKPEHLILEKPFKAGHKSCYLDILVLDEQKRSLFMIECKTWGDEYNKEKNRMFKDGGQLLSYYRQDKKVKAICLYASQFENRELDYISEIIDTQNLKGDNEQEIFDSWDKSFNKKGIFEESINAYSFENIGLTYQDLKDLKKSDGGTIFNQFAEILRRNIVSDKTNAFNKIFNLFICKIQDEDDKMRAPNEDLQFQVKNNDTYETLFDRLNSLYKKGNENYINVILPDISDEDFENLLKLTDGKDEKLRKTFKELRYYRSSQEFSFKEVYNKETFEENAEIVKEVVKLLENFKIKYSKKHQYLGDFFELLLNTGIKQEVGQFFTPIPLTRFVCRSLPIKEIIDRKNNAAKVDFLPYVIDYACGSGHFLTEIMDEIDSYVQAIEERDIKGSRQAIKNFKKNYLLWSEDYIYGIEKDYRLVKISKVSAFLNGDGDAKVMSTDGLAPFTNRKYEGILKTEETQKENAVFDILAANPPYSVSGFRNTLIDGEKTFDLYKDLTDKSSEIECLFVERAKQLLKENSVAGIVLPISILTNGGIYTKTREILLKYFYIKAIVSLGSSAFMATGTKTIILFLQRKNNFIHIEIDKYVNYFFKNYSDITVNNVQQAFSTYVRNIYNDLDFKDYVSILREEPTEKAERSEIYKDYEGLSNDEIRTIEKHKLFYFLTAYPQKVVLGDSKDKIKEKEFYGYEFSNRRGYEGIHIYKDEMGNVESKLYNSENLEDTEKMNYYILNNFRGNDVGGDIRNIKESKDHPLKEHIDYLRLSDLMTFDLKSFENSINLNNKKIKIESKYNLVQLRDVLATLESGKRGSKVGSKKLKEGIPSIGGEHINLDGSLFLENMKYISVDYFNSMKQGQIKKNDILLCKDGALTGKVAMVNSDYPFTQSAINEHIFLLRSNEDIEQKYLFYFLFLEAGQRLLKSTIAGAGQGGLNRSILNIKIPLPPFDIQKKIIDEIEVIEQKETQAKDTIEKKRNEITRLFSSYSSKTKETRLGTVISLEYGKSLHAKDRVIGNYPVYGSNGIDGYHNEYIVNAPAIIVGRKGAAGKVNWSEKNCWPIDTTFFVKLKDEGYSLKYIYYLLKNIKLDSDEFVKGTGVPGLNRNKAYEIKIDFLEKQYHDEFTIKIEELEKEKEGAKNYLAQTSKDKQKILDKYLI